MKKLLFVIMMLFCLMMVRAEGYEILSVHMKDGTSAQFLLNEEPKITFSELTVNVTSTNMAMEFEKTKVLKFIYGTGASVEEIKTDGTPFIQQDDKLLFRNLADRCIVTIFNVNGTMVQSPVVVTDNRFEISIANLSAGVYIGNLNIQSYKIIKR